MGPIGGIFNLAGQLEDGVFDNQDATKFAQCLAPKALATQYMDELSRIMCPDLHYFVVFSSVSSGFGNAGQSNYGMANSIMERIIEQRHSNGLPAKAIQLGAIGEVGLFYNLFLKKINNQFDFEMFDGIVPQSISTFLDNLDALIPLPDPIVTSMAVTEKKSENVSKVSLIEKLRSKYGIPANTPLELTLIELGVDSFSFLEMRRDIETEAGLQIELENLKTMTLKSITELVKGEKFAGSINLDETVDEKIAFAKLFGNSLTFAKHFKTEIIKMNNINDTKDGKCVLIIPGIDGITTNYHFIIAKSLKHPTFALHYFNTFDCTSVREIVGIVYEVTTFLH
jgi:fatty acid synthase